MILEKKLSFCFYRFPELQEKPEREYEKQENQRDGAGQGWGFWWKSSVFAAFGEIDVRPRPIQKPRIGGPGKRVGEKLFYQNYS